MYLVGVNRVYVIGSIYSSTLSCDIVLDVISSVNLIGKPKACLNFLFYFIDRFIILAQMQFLRHVTNVGIQLLPK